MWWVIDEKNSYTELFKTLEYFYKIGKSWGRCPYAWHISQYSAEDALGWLGKAWNWVQPSYMLCILTFTTLAMSKGWGGPIGIEDVPDPISLGKYVAWCPSTWKFVHNTWGHIGHVGCIPFNFLVRSTI